MFKKVIIFIMILTVVFNVSGCLIKSKTYINMRENVGLLGIDDVGGKIKITIVLNVVSSAESGGDVPKIEIYTSYGETLFDAIRNAHAYTERAIFWGHMNFIVIGEATAKKGINQYLDIIVRDHEIKQNSKIVIAESSTAEEFIKTTNFKNQAPCEVLESLFSDTDALSISMPITILDYMQSCSSQKDALYIPAVKTVDEMEKTEDDKEKKNMKLSGYALFDDDALIGFLGAEKARGMNWIINEIGTGIIVVEDSDKKKISMEIIGSKAKINPDFSNDKPTATIEIEFETNIGEYQGSQDIFKSDQIDKIIDQQNEVVKKEVTKAVDYLQGIGTDTLGVTNRLYHKYPKKTHGYDNIWSQVFSDMEINIKIKSSVKRTYNINQPINHKEKREGDD